MEKEIIQKFVLDKDWSRMVDYICSFFDYETDLRTMDTDKDSTAIHAEVVARKKIADNIDRMRYAFEVASDTEEKKKTSFK